MEIGICISVRGSTWKNQTRVKLDGFSAQFKNACWHFLFVLEIDEVDANTFQSQERVRHSMSAESLLKSLIPQIVHKT